MTPKEVVDELNDLIWNEKTEYYNLSFSYRYCTTYEAIYFEEYLLWCSEDDERKWIEDKQDYEDLLQYCKRKFSEFGDTISNLNLLLNKETKD